MNEPRESLQSYCPSNPSMDAHPDDMVPGHRPTDRHECSPNEARCSYCGVALYYNCNGCGRYLSAAVMAIPEYRCEECA